MDVAYAKQNEAMGFASIMTISNEAAPKGKKCQNKGKGKKRAVVAVASVGADV